MRSRKLSFLSLSDPTLLFLYIFSEFLNQIPFCSTYRFSSFHRYLELLTQRCTQFLKKLIRMALVLTAYQRNSLLKIFRSNHHSVNSCWIFLLLFPFLPQTCETCRSSTQDFYSILHSFFSLLQRYPVIPAGKNTLVLATWINPNSWHTYSTKTSSTTYCLIPFISYITSI